MSQIYEIRLKKEFELLQKLQRHPSVNNDIINISIQYKERLNGKEYKSVLDNPGNDKYPNYFRITYRMPIYVSPGELKKDWQSSFLLYTPEDILMNPNAKLNVSIEGGEFPKGFVPYNPMVCRYWCISGIGWDIAQQGYGIWYFIIGLGCTLNMEKFVMPDEKHPIMMQTYWYWIEQMKMEPINKIDWPFHLMDNPSFGIPNSKNTETKDSKKTICIYITKTGERIPFYDMDIESTTSSELIKVLIDEGFIDASHFDPKVCKLIGKNGKPIINDKTLAELGYNYGDIIQMMEICDNYCI